MPPRKAVAPARSRRVTAKLPAGKAPRAKAASKATTAKLAELTERLREAEETLDAIRGGHVDALVIQGDAGEQVFTLRGADHRYRQLVETMNEGALLIADDATIVYGNARFAQLAGVPLEQLIGSKISTYVDDDGQRVLAAVLAARDGEHAKAEVELVAAGGARVPVYLSATASWEEDGQLTCVIATDLSAQRRSQALIAAEGLASLIVEQAADSVVVCDPHDVVIRASNAAHRISRGNPLLKVFDAAFRICDPDGREAARSLIAATREGQTIIGRELTLELEDAPAIDILLSAAPILSRDGASLGTVVSFVDITARKRLAAERLALLEAAEAARAEAEAANRAKDEFLAMLGHELRNPLAPILTALELMRAQPAHAAELRREREIIERQVKHVVTLVDDLLDVSRITRGKIDLELRPRALAGIVARAVEHAGPLIEERGHRLTVEVSDELWVHADDTRLCQVLSNLLVNAAKYTPRGGAIALTAAREGDAIAIRVLDNGIGIAPEMLPHLFERFVQGKRSLDRAEGGLGLGLAIVHSLVALHGGTVRARSAGVGQGSELEVRIPAVTEVTAKAAAPSPRASTEPGAAARRVLVVDDNIDAADLLAEALGGRGHEVRVAYDGASALAVVAEWMPEVGVLDLGLPEMTGFELAQRLRQLEPAQAPLRLIALTGYGQESDRRRTADAGFDAHLVKPVDLGSLVKTLEA